MAKTRRPLEGVKCVTATIFQQGPVCFAHMADFGAEVIKIEQPGNGELGRYLTQEPGYELNPYFETNNRGVKCITLNFKNPKGREILYKLVKDVDVFAENYRHGVSDRNGFGYDAISKINPRIVYLSASAYGPDGPGADLPGTDGVGQAVGGICSCYGEPTGVMATGQVAVADETAALTNFAALMVGLYHAKMTGEGQKIETSLLGGQVRLMGFSMTRALLTGKQGTRGRVRIAGGSGPLITASFKDKDGSPFMFQMTGEDNWEKGMKATGFMPKLIDMGCSNLKENAENPGKLKVFLDYMDGQFATKTRDEWLTILRAADVVSAPIYNLVEASADPDVVANKYIIEVDHPKYGKVKEVGFPWKFSKTPPSAGIAPGLGEHNEEVYGALGYSKADLAALKKEGAI
jgi:crotonobetainyl-CoA:carnitine CoA-transferase CaiB-like acyl-CoA transferase